MSDLSEARKYILQRVSAENSYGNNLADLIDKYAIKLVNIAYSAGIQPNTFSFSNGEIRNRVDELISQLESEIIDYIDTLAVSTHINDKDGILAYIHDNYNGETMDDVIQKHTSHWKYELEASIAAAILTSVTKDAIIKSLKTFRRNTWRNPILLNARKGIHTNSKVKWLYTKKVNK